MGCHTTVYISATTRATSVAVVSSKRLTKLTQSEEPTACVAVSIASCGGGAGFSDGGMKVQATVLSNDRRQTWDAFSEAMRVRLVAETDLPLA